MAKGRKLPTHAYAEKIDVFDDNIVTALDPKTPRIVRWAISPRDCGGLTVTTTILAAVLATGAHVAGVIVDGAAWGLFFAVAIGVYALRWAIIWRTGGYSRWVAEAEGFHTDDEERFPSNAAIAEAAQARKEIRDVAKGPAGHHISDDLLETIESVIYQATRTRERRAALVEKANAVVGNGPHAEKVRARYGADADAELARLRRYRDALSALAAAANEAHHEYSLLAEAGLELDASDDLVEAQLRDTLAAAAADLRAVAAAAAEIRGTTPAMAEVAAAAEANTELTGAAITAAAEQLTVTSGS